MTVGGGVAHRSGAALADGESAPQDHRVEYALKAARDIHQAPDVGPVITPPVAREGAKYEPERGIFAQGGGGRREVRNPLGGARSVRDQPEGTVARVRDLDGSAFRPRKSNALPPQEAIGCSESRSERPSAPGCRSSNHPTITQQATYRLDALRQWVKATRKLMLSSRRRTDR